MVRIAGVVSPADAATSDRCNLHHVPTRFAAHGACMNRSVGRVVLIRRMLCETGIPAGYGYMQHNAVAPRGIQTGPPRLPSLQVAVICQHLESSLSTGHA
jgi:hypothetical protein